MDEETREKLQHRIYNLEAEVSGLNTKLKVVQHEKDLLEKMFDQAVKHLKSMDFKFKASCQEPGTGDQV